MILTPSFVIYILTFLFALKKPSSEEEKKKSDSLEKAVLLTPEMKDTGEKLPFSVRLKTQFEKYWRCIKFSATKSLMVFHNLFKSVYLV